MSVLLSLFCTFPLFTKVLSWLLIYALDVFSRYVKFTFSTDSDRTKDYPAIPLSPLLSVALSSSPLTSCSWSYKML